MIYLVDGLCSTDRSIKFHSTLKKFFSLVEIGWRQWEEYCTAESMLLIPKHKNDLWIVVCDDTPFCFPILDNPLTRRGINLDNTFFVYYENLGCSIENAKDKKIMDMAKRSLEKLYQNKNGMVDYERFNHHLVLIDSVTNHGMERLIDAVRQRTSKLS